MKNVILILNAVEKEIERSYENGFPLFNSSHEGIAIIREEFEELWDEIKDNKKENSYQLQIKEATHLAAMAIKFIDSIEKIIIDNKSRVKQ